MQQEYEHQIKTLLREEPNGITILEIADKIGLNRNSTARYLDILASKQEIEVRQVGPAKLYKLCSGPSLPVQLELFKKAMDQASCGLTIADAQCADMPLIYVNEKFCEITGYSQQEALGKNCRFLQADDRDQKCREKLRNAIEKQQECTCVMTNYTKSGEKFKNELHIAPIFDEDGTLTHYVGVQTKK